MASHGKKNIGDQCTAVTEQEPISRTNPIEEAKLSSGMEKSLALRRFLLTLV